MAIYSAVPPPPTLLPPQAAATAAAAGGSASHGHGHGHGHQHAASTASTATIDIEAWTIEALEALSVSPVARGIGGTPLAIPIDDSKQQRVSVSVVGGQAETSAGLSVTPPRRPPSRRDSQRRRDALLKGKEGSRQRRRWENDRLMHVPNVQPPLPADWEVRPTHPVHPGGPLPYHVAQFWDKGLRQRAEEAQAARERRRREKTAMATMNSTTTPNGVAGGGGGGGWGGGGVGRGVGCVPRELRNTAKRTPAVKAWVRLLEEPVRRFLLEEDEAERMRRDEEGREEAHESEEMDSEDEEIVFIGRGAAAAAAAAAATRNGNDGRWKRAHREVRDAPVDSGVVFDELGGDEEGGAFRRYLTHSISDYYGLASRSATVGVPPRRVVYVGIKQAVAAPARLASGRGGLGRDVRMPLPRPMWELF